MHLRRIKLKNFRNYAHGEALLSPRTNIIIGANGAGKSNLLESVQYVTCGRSFRTSREAEMVAQGAGFLRIEADIEASGCSISRSVAAGPDNGVRVDAGGGERWLDEGSILCFSPDDLQLVKGAPSLRRRFLDGAMARRKPAHRRALLDYQKVLTQRNGFLQRARAGLVQLSQISPWDMQLVQLAAVISGARADFCVRLEPFLGEAYSDICGGSTGLEVRYRSQLLELPGDGPLEERLARRLEETWARDMERAQTGTGIHRDDIEFVAGGKSLKPYGSQGEQRAAVLSLLLAERNLSVAEGGEAPVLLLDDVMSELDPGRRRRLMRTLESPGGGQVLITAADRGLFSEEELGISTVMEVCRGAILESWAGTNA